MIREFASNPINVARLVARYGRAGYPLSTDIFDVSRESCLHRLAGNGCSEEAPVLGTTRTTDLHLRMQRMVTIWEERGVFDSSVLTQFRTSLCMTFDDDPETEQKFLLDFEVCGYRKRHQQTTNSDVELMLLHARNIKMLVGGWLVLPPHGTEVLTEPTRCLRFTGLLNFLIQLPPRTKQPFGESWTKH